MNSQLLSFFQTHYSPARIALVGANDIAGWLVRNGQFKITADRSRQSGLMFSYLETNAMTVEQMGAYIFSRAILMSVSSNGSSSTDLKRADL